MENVILEKSEEKSTIDRKEFMRQVGIGFGAIMLMNCLQSCSGTDEIPDPSPTTSSKLDFTIDLKTATYSSLSTKGNFLVIKAQNVIVAHTSADAWIAVDSRCTHELYILDYRAATNDFICANHGSKFSATGAVTNGPANAPLTRYNTSIDLTNNTLRIFA